MGLSKEGIVSSLQDLYGDSVTAADIRAWCAMNDVNYQTVTNKIADCKVSRGKWNLTVQEKLEQNYQAPAAMPAIEQNLIPEKDDSFVKFGNFADVKKIIQSRLFYPTFITGLSGNGKTLSVEQACATLGRELIRVNITIETDEDDLIGASVLLMAKPSGTMAQSLKHSNEELSCSLMRSTSLVTKFSVSKVSLKEMESFLKRSESLFDPLQVSMSSQPQTLKVKVQTMDDSLELTCSTKHSLSDSQ